MKHPPVMLPQVAIFTGTNGPTVYVGNRLAFPQQVIQLNGGTTKIQTLDLVRLWSKEPSRSPLERERARFYLAFHERRQA